MIVFFVLLLLLLLLLLRIPVAVAMLSSAALGFALLGSLGHLLSYLKTAAF